MSVERRISWPGRLERWLPSLYVLLALSIQLLLCVLTPPFFTPDEPHHAARAISLSHGEWIAHATAQEETGAEIDANALRVMDGMDRLREAAEKRSSDFLDRPWGPLADGLPVRLTKLRWAGRLEFTSFLNTAAYPPVLYAPEMVGWRLGEAADLTIVHSLQLARALAALASVGIGWVALRICFGSRWVLFAYLLLPSTLFLDASCAQEPVLLSVAGLLAAVLSRALVEGREFRRGELAAMALLIALCATARPPYLAFGLLLFLPGAECRGGRALAWKRWVEPVAAFVCVLAVSAAWRHMVLRFGLDSGPSADPEDQSVFVHGHPMWTAWFVARGAGTSAMDLVRRGLYVVGSNDLLAPAGLREGVAACWSVLLLFAPTLRLRTWRGRGLLAAATLAPLLGISFAEYIIWTPPGGRVVYGIQPRYWLPVLPLLAMLMQELLRPLRQMLERVAGGAGRGLVVGAVGGTAVLACTLPWVVAHAFYLDGVGRVLRLNLR